MLKIIIKILFILLVIIATNAQALNGNKPDPNTEIDTNAINILLKNARLVNQYTSNAHIQFYREALINAKEIDFKNGINRAYIGLINSLFYKEFYDLALTYALEYKEYAEQSNNQKNISQANLLLGNLFSRQKNFKKSLQHHHLSKAYYKNTNDDYMFARNLVSIAITYNDLKNFDSASYYLKQSIQLFKSNNHISELANSTLGLAEIELGRKKTNLAKDYAINSLLYYNSIQLNHGICNTYGVLSQIYMEEKKYDSCLFFAKKSLAISKELNLLQNQNTCLQILSNAYYKTKIYDSAFVYLEKHKLCNDSLTSRNSVIKMDNSIFKYDLYLKETTLAKQNDQIIFSKKQNNLLFIILTLISLCLTISILAFKKNSKATKKIVLQNKELEEKQNEILASIRYAKRLQQSLLPTEKYITKNLKKQK